MNLSFGAVNLDSAPSTDPYLPQLWVDETGNRLCYWSGTSWQVLPIAVKAGANISVAQNADGSVTVTGTGGGGSQTLAQTLALGNNVNGFAITNDLAGADIVLRNNRNGNVVLTAEGGHVTLLSDDGYVDCGQSKLRNVPQITNNDGAGTYANLFQDKTNGFQGVGAGAAADGGSYASYVVNNITHRNAVMVQADNGFAVRNAADNADAAVTCGKITITSPTVPATSSDTGIAGQIAWDAAFFYVCTGTNTWVRTALTTW